MDKNWMAKRDQVDGWIVVCGDEDDGEKFNTREEADARASARNEELDEARELVEGMNTAGLSAYEVADVLNISQQGARIVLGRS